MSSELPKRESELELNGSPRSVRLYRTIVMALAVLVIAIAIWPKQADPLPCGATVELSFGSEPIDSALLDELIEESRKATLSPDALRETVDLAWNQWSATHRTDEALDRNGWTEWLARAVQVIRLDDSLGDYQQIEVRVEGETDPFISHLVNRAALAFASNLERQLIREEMHVRWVNEQAKLEDALNRRRRWFEQFDATLQQQNNGLRVITTASSGNASSTSLISTSDSRANEPLPPSVDIILADLSMRTEMFELTARQRGWTNSHPDYVAAYDQLQTLRRQVAQALVDCGRRPADFPLVAGMGPTTGSEQVNEFFPNPNNTPDKLRETGAALEELTQSSLALDGLRGEARELLGEEERLGSELTGWVDGTSQSNHRVRVLELADEPKPLGAAIRSSHWLMMSLLASGLAVTFGWNLSRQPDRFFSAEEVGESLALPVLGVVPGDTAAPHGFWVSVKRNERRIQWICEAILIGTVALVGLSLLIDPRLFSLLVDHPLDGLARSLQVIFGR